MFIQPVTCFFFTVALAAFDKVSMSCTEPEAFLGPSWYLYLASTSGVMQVSMTLSCILGLTVSHSTFVCTRVNDPIMTSTAGNLKNVIMTMIGAFAFGDFRFSVWNSIGLAMSMVGAIWYAAKSAMKVFTLLSASASALLPCMYMACLLSLLSCCRHECRARSREVVAC